MKTSSKFLALLFAAVMMLTLFAGCQEGAGNEESDVLTVALSPDFSPMEFVDTSKSGQDQYVGFDVMLAKYIAEKLGKELEIRAMSFDACQTAVQLGSVDLSISGYSWTEDRAENYLMSDYYYAGENAATQTLIVRADEVDSFTSLEDFAGCSVGAQTASLQMDLCRAQLPEDVDLQEFKAIDDAVLALKTDKLDAVAVEGGNGAAIVASNPDVALSGVLFSVDEASENNVIILNKEDTELLEQVNEILAEAEAAGLYGEWYAEALELAGVESASEVKYDDDGNVVEDDDATDADDADTTDADDADTTDADDADATDTDDADTTDADDADTTNTDDADTTDGEGDAE